MSSSDFITITHLPDVKVSEAMDSEIRGLLSQCFPEPRFHTQRFNYEMPVNRWMARTPDGRLVAHAACHDKVIGTQSGELHIFGVAEVCVSVDYRCRGLVSAMLRDMHSWARSRGGFDFSLLFGRPEIYRSSGYEPARNPIRRSNGDRIIWECAPMSSALFHPLGSSAWPDGVIDLRGPLF